MENARNTSLAGAPVHLTVPVRRHGAAYGPAVGGILGAAVGAAAIDSAVAVDGGEACEVDAGAAGAAGAAAV